MPERNHYDVTTIAAEAMYAVMEGEYQQGARDLDAMMIRLKDLSAYSLTHVEIMTQREGVGLLVLGMFFEMTSQSGFHENQARLQFLSEEVITRVSFLNLTYELTIAPSITTSTGEIASPETNIAPLTLTWSAGAITSVAPSVANRTLALASATTCRANCAPQLGFSIGKLVLLPTKRVKIAR